MTWNCIGCGKKNSNHNMICMDCKLPNFVKVGIFSTQGVLSKKELVINLWAGITKKQKILLLGFIFAITFFLIKFISFHTFKVIAVFTCSGYLLLLVIKACLRKQKESKKSFNDVGLPYVFLGIAAFMTPIMLWTIFSDLTMSEESRLRNIEEYQQKQFYKSLSVTCYQFSKARQECATAGSYSQCMEIKGGGNPNFYAYINLCNDDGTTK
jgi:hypothetical protein